MTDLRHLSRLAALSMLITLTITSAVPVQAKGDAAKIYPEKPVRIIVPLATG
jgi:hypothetical protein